MTPIGQTPNKAETEGTHLMKSMQVSVGAPEQGRQGQRMDVDGHTTNIFNYRKEVVLML